MLYLGRLATINSRLTEVALALSVYRTHAGHYPRQLGVFVPKYLPILPKDPWCEGPFLYRREGDGYLLYSVGPNGVNDTGPRPSHISVPPDPPALANSDDIGIRMPDPIDEDE